MQRLLIVFAVAGCTTRPITPPDMSVGPTVIYVQPDMAQPPPCTLTAAGDAFATMSWPDPMSNWYSSGLLRRSDGKRVVQYGSVQLRFGGWSDPAVYAQEFDVGTWPPTALSMPTQIVYSHHEPSLMFEPTPGGLGAIWWMDTDGVGPAGTAYSGVDPSSFAVAPQTFLAPNGGSLVAHPEPLADGKSFALLVGPGYGQAGTVALGVFGTDGSAHAQVTVPSGVQGLGHIKASTFVFVAPTECADAGCRQTSLNLYRLDDKLGLSKAASLNAPVSGVDTSGVSLISDGATHHFVTWWEYGPNDITLFAQPVGDDGTATSPAEVWYSPPAGTSPTPWQYSASAGPMGVVYPINLAVPGDGGYHTHAVILQRQLVENAPIAVVPLDVRGGWGLATAQFDMPRTLILGYSELTPPSGTGAIGTLARYVCAEDAR